jgi:SAM-dependent methyltransferase
VPDDLFVVPRLARVYDDLEGPRPDLDAYLRIVDELGVRSVMDVGCGTGTLAVVLAARGLDVIGVDPAEASLEVARCKPGAHRVAWLASGADELGPAGVDLVVMTGNVAMVFLDDEQWRSVVASVRSALAPTGWWVFEVRDPAARGWEAWTPEATRQRVDTVEGWVTNWVEVTEVEPPFVTFVQHYRFADGEYLTSRSTLRFRQRDEIEAALVDGGFEVVDVRHAPDRPGLEHVFLARAVG